MNNDNTYYQKKKKRKHIGKQAKNRDLYEGTKEQAQNTDENLSRWLWQVPL